MFWVIYKGDLLQYGNLWDVLALIPLFFSVTLIGILSRLKKYYKALQQYLSQKFLKQTSLNMNRYSIKNGLMNKQQFEQAKNYYNFDEFIQNCLDYDNLTMEDYKVFMPKVLPLIMQNKKKDPVEIFQNLMEKLHELWDASDDLPFYGPWHHGIIPAILLQSLRNNGNTITIEDIKESYGRGLEIPAGSCGFCGICGGGSGVGIALSIAMKTTPFHEKQRSLVFDASQKTLKKIGILGGPRCCRLSAYVALEKGTEFLSKAGFIIESKNLTGYCKVYERNAQCHTTRCPYYSKNKIL